MNYPNIRSLLKGLFPSDHWIKGHLLLQHPLKMVRETLTLAGKSDSGGFQVVYPESKGDLYKEKWCFISSFLTSSSWNKVHHVIGYL